MSVAATNEPEDRTQADPSPRPDTRLDARFSWAAARGELAGPSHGQGVNIAYEAVGRHVDAGHGEQCALVVIPREGSEETWSYADLDWGSGKVADRLRELGVRSGQCVFTLLGRCPTLYLTALGAWKNRNVFSALYSAFGPAPIEARMNMGQAKVLVTTNELYRRKIAPIRDRLTSLEHVLLVGGVEGVEAAPGIESFELNLLDTDGARRLEVTSREATNCEDWATLHFTSGTTGAPKAAVHVHDAVVAHRETGRTALDIRAGDVYWCTADPGWVTGVSYGIIAPLSLGATLVVDEADFDAGRWLRILSEHGVNVWYTSPTAVRRLMTLDKSTFDAVDVSSLRFIASVGEPLDPQAVRWSEKAFGLPIHDNWWQTETGSIMIANMPGQTIKPGSMGRPVPGIEAAIMHRRADGGVEPTTELGARGELALRQNWPSMFRSYLNDEARYRRCFEGNWYLSGDLATVDADGYYWFVSRADDLIKSSGHLVGPFEVESALRTHPAVSDVAVIGIPDAVAGQVAKAFITLASGRTRSKELRRELIAHARERLGPALAPRLIEFIDSIPKTRSGKTLRRLIKARELGLPEGDLSTLEPTATGS